MSLETIGDILAVAFLVGVIAMAAGWLLGRGVYTPAAPTKSNRRRFQLAAAFAVIAAVTSAMLGDWVATVASGLLAALQLTMALAPDLPARLRTRPG